MSVRNLARVLLLRPARWPRAATAVTTAALLTALSLPLPAPGTVCHEDTAPFAPAGS